MSKVVPYKKVEKTLTDLPIELMGNIFSHVQTGCNDRTPVCFGMACKATHAAWKQHFTYLKPGEAEGRALITWLARAYPKHAARVLLTFSVPDPAAALACLAGSATKDEVGNCRISRYV
jgi:hypothetical protein